MNGNLTPDICTDVSLGTLVGRTSGESIRVRFEGEGWVSMLPHEKVAVLTRRSLPMAFACLRPRHRSRRLQAVGHAPAMRTGPA